MEESLREAVSLFSAKRATAIGAIRNLQAKDRANFVLAAARLVTNPETEKLPGAEYLGGLISGDDSLIDLLVDEKALTHEEAFAMVRRMAGSRPLLEARLMRKMLENADGTGAAVPMEVALRVMKMVEAISDCSRVAVYLTQLERHPSAEVRSKAALLLGRGNVNVGRVRRFLTSQDARLRANAVESLWGMNTPQARSLFWDAATDSNRRVSINALVGLCKAGDPEARRKLVDLVRGADPVSRRAAVWAMGTLRDAEFSHILEPLTNDSDENLRAMAVQSLAMLHIPPPAAEKPAAESAPAADSQSAV
jgi:HEAT repeat protein